MSGWDAYIAALLGDKSVMTGGAIYGQDAAPALWASSSASFIKPEEVAALYKGIKNQADFDAMSGTGFYVNGVKFMKLNSEVGSVVRGKQGENAAAAAFSKKAIIIGTGKGSPQEISNAVEKMAADLASKGF